MPHKVLVIDDEDDLRFMLMFRLEAEGFEVLLASNGAQGIEVALNDKPDAVILDLLMPKMTGYEVWREFKKDPYLKDIPILILTCERQAEDRFWKGSMPQEDFISKPYDDKKLVARLKQVIKEHPVCR